MSSKTVALAYSQENQATAQLIDLHLSQSRYSFQHHPCSKDTLAPPLAKQLRNTFGPILLLVSDNFLKSAQCMSNGLKFLQEKKDQVIPIIINGISIDEQGNETEVITEFDRVSDIIQYINYWQDQYLDLRRQKRHLRDNDPNFDEARFNEHLQIIRDISSEAGEFLRMLRNMDRITWDNFQNNNYQAFFKSVNDLNSWESIKSLDLSSITATTDAVEEEESEEIDITNIPGMDLLPDEPIAEVDQVAEEELGEAEEATDNSVVEEASLEINKVSDTEEEFEEEEEEITQEEINSIIQKSIRYFESDKPSSAFDYMDQALESYPNSTDLRYHYALMLARKGRNLDQALYHLDIALEMDPSLADAHFLKGEIAEIQEDYATAIYAYRAAVQNDGKNSEAYYRLGLLFANHVEEGEEQGASYLKKAIKLNPGHVDANYLYASVLYESLNKANKALKQFEQTLKLDDQHPFANYDIALIHHQNEKYELASSYYQKAISINPELKTQENDEAFGLAAESEPAPTPVVEEEIIVEEASSSSPVPMDIPQDAQKVEQMPNISIQENLSDPINALKDNIRQLEELLKRREQEIQEQEEALKAAEPKEERIALITGASAGIGKATAQLFAAQGYKLILTGRRKERLEALKAELSEEFEVAIQCLSFDVRDAEACAQAIASLDAPWKNIDILVNNAGKAKGKDPIHEGRLDHWEEMIDTNVKGLLYMSRAVAPLMVENHKGHIINVCSLAGKEVYPNGNVYCATKHAVDALTKGMQLDLHQHNIRVSQVSPAMVEETEFAKVRFDGDEEKAKIYEGFQPLVAKDVAETIHFIANQPKHVNIQDVVMMGIQQPNSVTVDRSGRKKFE